MDALSEVDADGNAVGASGSVKHSINSFAPQAFEFAPQEEVKIGTASATKVSFSTPFKGTGCSFLGPMCTLEDAIMGSHARWHQLLGLNRWLEFNPRY
jgi:hypothetical protein